MNDNDKMDFNPMNDWNRLKINCMNDWNSVIDEVILYRIIPM